MSHDAHGRIFICKKDDGECVRYGVQEIWKCRETSPFILVDRSVNLATE